MVLSENTDSESVVDETVSLENGKLAKKCL